MAVMVAAVSEAMALVVVERVRAKAGCGGCSLVLYGNPRSPGKVWARHGVAGIEQRAGFDPEGEAWVSALIAWVRAGHE